jgi:hypothetical protein
MGRALRAALSDFYGNSWRLVVLNSGLWLVLLPLLVLALWAPLALVLVVLAAGPLAMALMHCAVTLAETEELGLRCAVSGLRLHWRRGLVLGVVTAFVGGVGVVALVGYGRAGYWPLVAIVLYLLAAFGVLQVCLWPLAALERSTPLLRVGRAAFEVFLRRPLQVFALALALLLVNLAGAAAALMPLLTLTVAYSFLAAAHYVLPRNPLREVSP